MNDVRFVYAGPADAKKCRIPNGATLYINGHKLEGVLEFVPNLVKLDEVATVTVTLAVSRFVAEGGEAQP